MSVGPERSEGPTRRVWIPVAVACLVLAAFYAAPFGVRHIRVPVADDSFFYVWAVRFAGQFGIADSHLAARPAFPLLGSVLGTVGGASPWLVTVAFPITMAIGLALAGGAIAARWGMTGWAAALFVILTSASAVVARLVAGKTENLLTLWLIASIVAVAVWGRKGRAGFAAIAGLSLGASLSEWPFVAAFVALVVGGIVLTKVFGSPSADRTLEAILWPAVLGLGVGLLVVSLWNRTGLGSVVQALPPDFAYGKRFRIELSIIWPAVTIPLTALGWWASRATDDGRARQVRRLSGLWLVLTALVLLTGVLGLHLPTYRALTFGLPLALAVAAAPFVVRRLLPSPSGHRRAVGWIVGAAVVLVALVPASALWYRDFRGRASLEQIAEFAAAARYSLSSPDRHPAVIVVNQRIERVYFYERLAADVLPPERRKGLLVFVGASSDLLAGRPTLVGDPARDRLARTVLAGVRPAIASGAPILTGTSLDQVGFEAARQGGAPLIGGGRVAILRGQGPVGESGPVTILPIPDWWGVLLLSLAWLILLTVCGAGWSIALLAGAPFLVRAALAPAFGASALALVSLIGVHLSMRVAGPGGVAALAVAALGSAAAALAARRSRARVAA
jgi:hypothetical protein